MNPFPDEFPDVMIEEEIYNEPKILPPYHVIIQNDDLHSMEFVFDVLRKVFGYNEQKCYKLMMTAHDTGLAIVWTGSKEVAELKLEQINTFHEDRNGKNLGPLGAYIEAAE